MKMIQKKKKTQKWRWSKNEDDPQNEDNLKMKPLPKLKTTRKMKTTPNKNMSLRCAFCARFLDNVSTMEFTLEPERALEIKAKQVISIDLVYCYCYCF